MQSLSTHDQRMLSYDYRWSQFKTGASRRNISVDIDKRQYTQLICSPCHYCARTPAAAFRIGIDRIDSSKAYTSSNCVSCCKSCNFMKNTMRYDDFISQAHYLPLLEVTLIAIVKNIYISLLKTPCHLTQTKFRRATRQQTKNATIVTWRNQQHANTTVI